MSPNQVTSPKIPSPPKPWEENKPLVTPTLNQKSLSTSISNKLYC